MAISLKDVDLKTISTLGSRKNNLATNFLLKENYSESSQVPDEIWSLT
jgi:hypothetical protein